MPAVPVTNDRLKEIALALLKQRYKQVNPAEALDAARKLHVRIVGLGYTSDDATEFASAMLDAKIKEAIAGAAKKAGESEDEIDINAKLDEIFRLGGELFRRVFKKPGSDKKGK